MEDPASKTGELEKLPSVSPNHESRPYSPVRSLPPQTTQEAINVSTSAAGEDTNMGAAVESEKDAAASSGSAMDESIDSGRSMLVDQPPAPEHAVPEISETPKPVVPREASSPATENKPDSLPERPPSLGETDTPAEAPPNVVREDLEKVHASRESSIVSDVYEPPEPEPHPDSADTVYTPPFSPAPADRVEIEAAAAPSLPPSQPDKALTGEVQEPRPEEGLQFGILEVQQVEPCSGVLWSVH